jgi:hypothetical protein
VVCTGCHQDKQARWVAGKVREWYGAASKGFERHAERLGGASWNGAGRGAAEPRIAQKYNREFQGLYAMVQERQQATNCKQNGGERNG